jgi:hypothetical protein
VTADTLHEAAAAELTALVLSPYFAAAMADEVRPAPTPIAIAQPMTVFRGFPVIWTRAGILIALTERVLLDDWHRIQN